MSGNLLGSDEWRIYFSRIASNITAVDNLFKRFIKGKSVMSPLIDLEI